MIERWECVSCKTVLGFIEDKKVIRIKRKDLYVEVEGGKTTVTCYGCGRRNSLTYSNEKEFFEIE